MLAGVGERVQLPVAVRRAVRARRGRRSCRAAPPPAAISGQVPPTQTPCSAACAGQELRRRPALGLADPRRHREAGREGLAEQHELRPGAGGAGRPGGPAARSSPRGPPRRCRAAPPRSSCRSSLPPMPASRSTASASTSSPLQNANRTRCRPRCGVRRVVEHHRGDGDHAGPLGQRAAERQPVAVGLHRADVDGREVGGLRADHRQARRPGRPSTSTSRRYSQVAGRAGEVLVRAGRARRRRPAGTARR